MNHKDSYMIIYKTTCLINNKIYIGQTRYNNKNYFGSGVAIKSAIQKYGKENFVKEILEHCSSEEELNEREIYWIKEYNFIDLDIGYNILIGGNNINMFDQPNGDLIRDKISKNHAKPWLGKKQSKEIVEKRAKALKGRKTSLKGKNISDDHKQKISENNAKYWKGKHIPEYVKEKIREKRKTQNMSYRYANYTLLDKNGDKIFIECVAHFLKEMNLSKSQFYRLIRGDIKEYKGYSLYKGEDND